MIEVELLECSPAIIYPFLGFLDGWWLDLSLSPHLPQEFLGTTRCCAAWESGTCTSKVPAELVGCFQLCWLCFSFLQGIFVIIFSWNCVFGARKGAFGFPQMVFCFLQKVFVFLQCFGFPLGRFGFPLSSHHRILTRLSTAGITKGSQWLMTNQLLGLVGSTGRMPYLNCWRKSLGSSTNRNHLFETTVMIEMMLMQMIVITEEDDGHDAVDGTGMMPDSDDT